VRCAEYFSGHLRLVENCRAALRHYFIQESRAVADVIEELSREYQLAVANLEGASANYLSRAIRCRKGLFLGLERADQ
jgi:vacuolar-type H+-ATPase subunit D/Vma8